MHTTITKGILLALPTVAACSDVTGATDLMPEGPPRVLQVFMTERIFDPANNTTRTEAALAFGAHPDFNPADDGQVLNAVVAPDQGIRVVMAELLIGNYLEEVRCRDGSYARVPEGATPDDIQRCTLGQDVLPQTCTGRFALCMGGPEGLRGIRDVNEDGAADDTRMIPGAIEFDCGELPYNTDVTIRPEPDVRVVGTVDTEEGFIERETTGDPWLGPAQRPVARLRVHVSNSYWQPSGNQQVPTAGGFNSVGPALVLKPARAMPTSSTCTLVFGNKTTSPRDFPDRSYIGAVDKDHNQVCAPTVTVEDGQLVVGDCAPGDLARLSWQTEPLFLVGSYPPPGETDVPLQNMAADCPRDLFPDNVCGAARLTLNAPVRVDPATGHVPAGAIEVYRDGVRETQGIIVRPRATRDNEVWVYADDGWQPGAEYDLVITDGLEDACGIAIPTARTQTITFTTVTL
jgi:hypothetical protein